MNALRTLSIWIKLDGPAFIGGTIVGMVAGITLTGFLMGLTQ